MRGPASAVRHRGAWGLQVPRVAPTNVGAAGRRALCALAHQVRLAPGSGTVATFGVLPEVLPDAMRSLLPANAPPCSPACTASVPAGAAPLPDGVRSPLPLAARSSKGSLPRLDSVCTRLGQLPSVAAGGVLRVPAEPRSPGLRPPAPPDVGVPPERVWPGPARSACDAAWAAAARAHSAPAWDGASGGQGHKTLKFDQKWTAAYACRRETHGSG